MKVKLGLAGHPLDSLPDRLTAVGRHDRHIDVVHLGREGEAEKQNLDHGHQQRDEHRARIAENMQGLLADE